MTSEQQFLDAIIADPGSAGIRLAFADWLEERGDARAELIRVQEQLRAWGAKSPPERPAVEARMLKLISAGVTPIVPSMSNSIGMKFVLVPPGAFMMGSPKPEQKEWGESDEEPEHEVTLTRGFWLGQYAVTQAEYKQVMGDNPSYFSSSGGGKNKVNGVDTSRLPVSRISWEIAINFCQELTKRELAANRLSTGWEYRLPTEAQWEYACRAGTTTACYGKLDEIAWYKENSSDQTHRVGLKKPNAWGLYDMLGNVWEWCGDSKRKYNSDPQIDPIGTGSRASRRVLRGGAWSGHARRVRAAYRSAYGPGRRSSYFGFRCVRVQE